MRFQQVVGRCALSDNYDVGYKKPPQTTRFKKGQSGNPRGRPKGTRSKTPAEFLDHFLSQTITIKESGRAKKVTLLEALQKRLVTSAMNGDMTAMRLLQKPLEKIEALREDRKAREKPSIIKVQFVSGPPGSLAKDRNPKDW